MNGKCKPKKEGCKAPVHLASRIRGVEYSITEYFVVLCFFFFGSEEADLETLMFLVLQIVIFFDKDLLDFCHLLQHENRGSSSCVTQRKDIR